MAAGKGAGFDANALFQGFGAKIGPPGPDGHNGLHRIVAGVDAHFAIAHERKRTHIAFGQFVDFKRFHAGFYQLFYGKSEVHA